MVIREKYRATGIMLAVASKVFIAGCTSWADGIEDPQPMILQNRPAHVVLDSKITSVPAGKSIAAAQKSSQSEPAPSSTTVVLNGQANKLPVAVDQTHASIFALHTATGKTITLPTGTYSLLLTQFDAPPESTAAPSEPAIELSTEPALPMQTTPFELLEPAAPTARATAGFTGQSFAAGSYPRLDSSSATFGTADVTAFSGSPRKFSLHPHLALGAVYDSNISLRSGSKKEDVILTIAPGMGLVYGSDLSTLQLEGDYTAGFNFFTDNTSSNSIDQNFRLQLMLQLSKLRLGFRLGLESLEAPDVDVGDRVRRTVYYAGFTSEYQATEKIDLQLNADYTYSDYRSLIDSQETRLELAGNYKVTPKLKLGLAATAGRAEADSGPVQTYEQGRIRASYAATERFSINGNVGVEVRQFDGEHGTETTPVFGLGAFWTPFDGTSISVEGRRRVYTSAALDRQNYASTGVVVSARQRFATDYSLSLSLGYENASYTSTTDGINASREDHYFFVRPGVQWRIKDWSTVGVFYNFSKNESSGAASDGFIRHQVGVSVTIAF